MPVTLPVDPAADAYADVAFGDAYFTGRPNAAHWTGGTTEEREWALKMSTSLLDAVAWRGTRAYTVAENALQWPRTGYDPDDISAPTDSVPRAIQNATCEQALYLLQNGTLASGQNPLTQIKVGSISLSYAVSDQTSAQPIFSGAVLRMIARYIGVGFGGTLSLVRA